MKKITSQQNPRLKNAVRLKTSRGRKTQRRLIVFGLREVQRAIASGIQPLEIFLCSEMMTPAEVSRLQLDTSDSTEFYDLPIELMQRLKYGDREVLIVAVAQRPELSLDKMALVDNPLVVILESIEKPGNIGAVLRSMDGAGASALILADPQCDVLHPNCIRASMGSAFTTPLAIATTAQTLAWCRENELETFAARDSAATSYVSTKLTGPIAIAFGNEATGLSPQWEAEGVQGISIPMQGISDSLNVSVAVAVMLYEALRQRCS